MRKILVLGAGMSASTLIKYFLDNAEKENWFVRLGDYDFDLAKSKINGHKRGEAFQFNVTDDVQCSDEISKADIVVSMLPARFHHLAAEQCLAHNKNLVTASYVSDELKAMHDEAISKDIIMLQEIGLDPGIDHMSAMKIIDDIKSKGGKISDFESFTGGLVAPESDNNPWGYKFTWNPRNVVLAGQGGACKFMQEGKYKYIPYHKLFRRTEIIEIDGYGKFEGYANRDSLGYRELYNLQDVKTMFRGTFRRPGYCRAWNCFVQLGATDDTYTLENSENMTYREFINTFLAYHPSDSIELKLRQYLNIPQDDVDLWDKLEYLDLFSDKKVGLKNATPAQILQHILEQKWTLSANDKDMIVMWHKFIYELDGETKEKHSSMICIGDDQTYTSMSKTVGLPLAIATKLILNGVIKNKGVLIPTISDIYNPVLEELATFNIDFIEKDIL